MRFSTDSGQLWVRRFKALHPVPYSLILLWLGCSQPHSYEEWTIYGGGKDNIRYSSLDQVNTTNIDRLRVKWIYETGDKDTMTQIQVNPIVVNDVLYGVSPKLKLFALEAASGKELWVFDPVKDTREQSNEPFQMNVCRGVAYYDRDGEDGRIFYSANARLYCIDASTGRLFGTFGEGGSISLHEGLGRDVSGLFVASTTPGIIYEDLIIIGTRVDEQAAAAPGHIRAFNVRSGKMEWIFHTIPYPDETGYDSWEDPEAYLNIGGANAWSGFSMDEDNGILFAPTGSASYDFYGGKRLGDNLFANSIIALDARTGKRIWHFQTVHHDVWDRDLPAAPAVIDLNIGGRKVEAIAQITKSGFVFLFNRHTGEPIYEIQERPVPTGTDLLGEQLSPTQPWPTKPEPFSRQSVTEADLNDLVAEQSYLDIRDQFRSYRTGDMFTPPSFEGTIIMPGFDGGGEWGGPAFDPETGLLYVNANEMPWILTMVPTAERVERESVLDAGYRLYTMYCMACHGPAQEGSGDNPPLTNISERFGPENLRKLIASGRRMMPAFDRLPVDQISAITAYLLEQDTKDSVMYSSENVKNPYWSMPYQSTGYNKFLTREGYPAIKPPWGTLNAINLVTGVIEWKTTIGNYPEFEERGIVTGTENYGGPVVTAGGLVFLGATRDSKFRVFDKHTGETLYETTLPAPGFATPAVYEVNGRQQITIACGGGKVGTRSGDAYVTFALDE